MKWLYYAQAFMVGAALHVINVHWNQWQFWIVMTPITICGAAMLKIHEQKI